MTNEASWIDSLVNSSSAFPISAPIQELLAPELVEALSLKYRVYYQVVGTLGEKNCTRDIPSSGNVGCDLSYEYQDLSNVDFLVDFADGIMAQSAARLSQTERETLKALLKSYMSDSTHRVVYYLAGKPVAALYVNSSLHHPLLNEEVVHIGFIGIENSLLDRTLRTLIRGDFKRQLELIAKGRKISGRIAAINAPSLRYAAKMGGTPAMIVIDGKS